MDWRLSRIMTHFEPTRESLNQFQVPDWFRDAKFGIYCHWGPQCVPMCDGWYARNMYVQGHRAYKHHLKQYGHPSKFGYKDVIQLWTAEKFNPDELVALFKEAGARYFTPVAVHHDNFDLWDSQYTRWNAVKIGPKKDIIGMWRNAALKQGLIFGVTTHLERSFSWMQVSHHADTYGPLKGVNYDGNDPEFEDLYFDAHGDDNFRSPKNPPVTWRKLWQLRIKDLIDHYHPALLYFDGACPFQGEDQGQSGMEVIAHLYNDNLKQSQGASNGVHFIKHIEDHGIFIPNICLIDYEGHAQDKLDTVPWQTDLSIGDWFYRKPDIYRSATNIIHQLVNIVSKNGNLLLNIPPRPDGSLDPRAIRTLKKIGKWMKRNGESIYCTRPWKIASEKDIRFVIKGNILYLTKFKRPIRQISIKSLGTEGFERKIKTISDLDTNNTLVFSQESNRLLIRIPLFSHFNIAKVFKIEFH
jgi:alpha-L-fucosidase